MSKDGEEIENIVGKLLHKLTKLERPFRHRCLNCTWDVELETVGDWTVCKGCNQKYALVIVEQRRVFGSVTTDSILDDEGRNLNE